MEISTLREIMKQAFPRKAALIDALGDDDNFIDRALFDSLEIIRVITAVEAESGTIIDIDDLSGEKMGTLRKLAELVIEKKK